MKLSRPTSLPILPFGAPDQGFSTMRVTSPFGWRDTNGDGKVDAFHGADDIGNAREGDEIIAVAPGRVLAAGYLKEPWSQSTTRYPSGNYGGMMVVQELAPGVVAIYAHMQPAIAVQAGQMLRTGQLIGHVGSTGSARDGGAHVHFGLQAPIGLVPRGVKTATTHYGLGLDVDPWPFISGQAELLDPKDDMRLQGKFLAHVIGERTEVSGVTKANFRSAPTMGAATILDQFAAGEAFIPVVMVEGEAVGTDAAKAIWYGGWLWVDGYWTFGYFHHSVLKEPFEKVASSLVKKAIDALNARLDQWVAGRPR